MARLTISLDGDTREDLQELAVQRRTTVAALARYALDKTYEDELDAIAAERALEEGARHPEEIVTLEQYMASRKEKGRG